MRKLSRAVLVLVMVFSSLGAAQAASSYWQRMAAGYPNQLVVYDYIYEYSSPEAVINAKVPQLYGFPDVKWQEELNQKMRQAVQDLADLVKGAAEEAKELEEIFHAFPYAGVIEYHLKLNQGGLLSIEVVTYTFTGGAHGMTVCDYINVDLTTGRQLSFADLFDTDEELARAAGVINAKIAEQPEWYFIEQFTPGLFEAEQGFYLTEDAVAICFPLYEIAPYAAGIQEFAVSAP